MSKKHLTPKERFDNIIKNNLTASGVSENEFEYSIKQADQAVTLYPLYFSKTAFNSFIQEMQTLYPQHYLKYNGNANATQNKGGAGGELIEKRGRYGITPPKMASVASSSRFCYLALRNGTDALTPYKNINANEIEFEKECRIFNDGTAPQLDAFVADEECNIYVEAKCHEIFGSHKVELKNKYLECFEKDDSLRKALEFADKNNDNFVLPLSLFGIDKPSSRFDIKQLICHLLGIKEQNKGKRAKLVYLFFEPSAFNDQDAALVNEVFNELANETKLIFNSDIIRNYCNANNIDLTALKEKSRVMEPLNKSNTFNLYI